ncbi:MAG: hypothetical protein J0L82_04345 [Deltaproteobacteria bacterium]|nr:hypothetical protein [Deltaproteobacteria bacterium]
MKKSSFALSLLVAAGTSVFASNAPAARGGVIGGGDVGLVEIFSCAAKAMDPAVPGTANSLVVVGEADYDGVLSPDATLTVVLTDEFGGQRFFPTQTLPYDFDPAELNLYRYAPVDPKDTSELISTLSVQGDSGSLLSRVDTFAVEDLLLENCAFVAEPQTN